VLLLATQVGWAVSAMGVSPSDTWWSWYLQHTCPRLRDMAPEQLCELVWAAAVMGRPPHKQWMEVWAAAVVRTLPVTPPDHLARMAWALAALQKVGVFAFMGCSCLQSCSMDWCE
jgi:hypothetical protein